jgi:hypothetical protein
MRAALDMPRHIFVGTLTYEKEQRQITLTTCQIPGLPQ